MVVSDCCKFIYPCVLQIFFLLLHSIFEGVEMKHVLYVIPRQLTVLLNPAGAFAPPQSKN